MRKGLLYLAAALAVVAGGLMANACTAMGGRATGPRKARMMLSKQWGGDRFVDTLPRVEPKILSATWQWITAGSEHRIPSAPIETSTAADLSTPPASGLRVTWFGHSTMLVEIDGRRVLLDPVWGERCSPVSWAGPKRFYPPPMPLSALPALDAVVISHDHYDHLDHPTIVELAKTEVLFVTPLGVGAHLEHWGVPAERIVELDWWQAHALGDLRLVATPSRHFSGRSLADRDQTLWAGWALLGPAHRVFYSGDTAMFPGFAEIGERLGPFDLTMIEAGAYNQLWADVHLGPEQAVEAHRMVRGELMMPVHWGLFDLALHGWTEPAERVVKAAEAAGVAVVTPPPGASFEPAARPRFARWWPALPWQSREQAPVVSSGLAAPLAWAAE